MASLKARAPKGARAERRARQTNVQLVLRQPEDPVGDQHVPRRPAHEVDDALPQGRQGLSRGPAAGNDPFAKGSRGPAPGLPGPVTCFPVPPSLFSSMMRTKTSSTPSSMSDTSRHGSKKKRAFYVRSERNPFINTFVPFTFYLFPALRAGNLACHVHNVSAAATKL